MKNDEESPIARKRLRTKWLETNADQASRSNKNERRLAKRLGGKRIARSGGKLWSGRLRGETARAGSIGIEGSTALTEGGDVAVRDFHFENKRTVKKSMGIQRDWLRGVQDAAKRMGKDPGLIITFEDGRKDPEDWVAVPIAIFERLRALKDR